MIVINSKDMGELDAIDKFFQVSGILNSVLEYLDGPFSKTEEQIAVFNAFAEQLFTDINGYIDIASPLYANKTTRSKAQNYMCNEFYMDLQDETGKSIRSHKVTKALYLIAADETNCRIMHSVENILPVVRFDAIGVGEDDIIYNNGSLINSKSLVKDVLESVTRGYMIIITSTTHFTTSDFSSYYKDTEKTIKHKFLNLVYKTEQSVINTKVLNNIYYLKWNLDNHGNNLVENSENQVNLYDPIIDPDADIIKQELAKIFLTGKGSIDFSIKGCNNDDTERANSNDDEAHSK